MTVRLYIDEDAMDKALVQALRARGVDVHTALEAGMLERLDEHHLEYATAQGRALYSFNVGDFYRLRLAFLAQGKTHMGIILAQQQRYTVGEQMRRLLRLTATRSPEDMQKPGGVSQFLGLRPSVSALAMRVDNWSKGSVGRGVQSCEDVAGWRTARLVVYAV